MVRGDPEGWSVGSRGVVRGDPEWLLGGSRGVVRGIQRGD